MKIKKFRHELNHVLGRALSAHRNERPSANRRNKTNELKKMISNADSHPCPICNRIMRCPEIGTVSSVLTHPNMPIGDHIVMLCLGGIDDISNMWICCNVCDKARGYTYHDRKESLTDSQVKGLVIWSILQTNRTYQSLAAELYPEHQAYFENKCEQILDKIELKENSHI